MSSKELVIKIPEEMYDWLDHGFLDAEDAEMLWKVVKNGIPIPKGHGKIIDVKKLRQDVITHKYSVDFCKEHNIDQSINVGILNILLTDALPIIEADEEGENNG